MSNNLELRGIEFEITGTLNSSTANSIKKVRTELEKLKQTMASGKLSGGYKSLSGIGSSSKKGETITESGNAETAKTNIRDLTATFQKMREGMDNAKKSAGELYGSLSRIAMYRLIRSFIKAITDGLSEGTQNMYQFSKAGGDMGVFAASMDKIATSFNYLANSVGAAISPIMNALAPALDWIIDKLVSVINLINQVLSLLGGAGQWTRALKYPKEFASAAGSAGKKLNELKKTILGFDEINKLTKQSDSSGGGGVGGLDYSKMFEVAEYEGKMAKLKELVQKHLTEVEMMLAGFEFTLGTILLLMGHPILGLGMMIHGASKLFATHASADWDSMSTETINTLTLIEGAVAGFSLALGALLLLTGASVPLGLGLLAIGAGMLVKAAIVNWKAAESNVTTALSTITGICMGALLALGVILLLNGHFGFGMAAAIAGIAGIVGSVMVNWKTAETEVGKALQSIMKTISGFLMVLGVIFFLTGNFPLGIGFMAAGAVGMVAAGTVNWDALGKKISEVASDGLKKWNKFKDDTINVFNKLKEKIMGVFSGFRNIHVPLPHFEWQTIGSGFLSLSVPRFTGWYANGGFPEDGLFMANHGELVGQFSNGKTAVANNAQIVEGIRQGVRDANSDEVRLLREQNDLLRQLIAKEGTVEIPLSSITTAMARKNQRDGGTFVPVG